MSDQTERAAFEAWLTSDAIRAIQQAHWPKEVAWVVWKARAAQPAAEPLSDDDIVSAARSVGFRVITLHEADTATRLGRAELAAHEAKR